MEDLLRSIRNIGLALPDPTQLLQLLDPDPEVQESLAQMLALNHQEPEQEDQESDADDDAANSDVSSDAGVADPLIDSDLFKGAVQALLENYRKAADKERDALKKEELALRTPKPLKAVPLKALLARQAAEIKRREEETYVAEFNPETGRKRREFYLPRQTFEGFGSYSSDKTIQELERIDIKQLQAPKRFEGKFLLCQVASRLNLYASCTFIAVLPSGVGLPVSISHFTSNLRLQGHDLDSHLPIGTVLAIKEPFISLNHFSKGGPATGGKTIHGVRVDTPSDVVILDPLDEEDKKVIRSVEWKEKVEASEGDDGVKLALEDVPSESVWRDSPAKVNGRGCLWLQDGPLSRLAARWARASSGSSKFSLPGMDRVARASLRQRTRSLIESFLLSDRPGSALRELTAARLAGVLSVEQVEISEDLELEGRILHRLGRFQQALEALDGAWAHSSHLSQDMEALRGNCKASALMTLQGPSPNDISKFYFDSEKEPTPRFEISDYLGPVEVRDIPNAGRGLVLSRDVEEGELLLACKAASSSYAIDEGCRGVYLMRYTVENEVTSTTTQVLAATKSIHAILDRPQLALPILGLTAGPGVPHSPWVSLPYPVPNRKPPTRDPAGKESLAQALEKPSINASYVNGVLRFNAFGPAASPGTSKEDDGDKKDGKFQDEDRPGGHHQSSDTSELSRSTMVHPLPAILNHACLPNVSSVFFGDIVTTRALHPLKAGTEIMHQYVRGEQPFLSRRSQLSKHGFRCLCQLCQMDERDGEENCKRRQRLVGGSLPMLLERSRILLKSRTTGGRDGKPEMAPQAEEGNLESHRDLSDSLIQLAQEVIQTYSQERPKLRPDLMSIYQKVAEHRSIYDLEGAADAEMRALESVGAQLGGGAARRENGDGPSPPSPVETLERLPDLHFDGAIKSLLSLACISILAGDPSQAKEWVRSAFRAHQSTICGGRDVFLDRWQGVGYLVVDRGVQLPLSEWI
ncbi:hypothetical protein IE53DRAFT_380495 [Violaceomyces palustris]|uniref:Uncharacterized protein n=1 Tax=Violaceomyces palustris TaxID=1673888 RepID=A0ACD0NUM0_9BASI|nr:hypothetical protein IE53DRAFT_380495 [Violaceomyces palustris]